MIKKVIDEYIKILIKYIRIEIQEKNDFHDELKLHNPDSVTCQ